MLRLVGMGHPSTDEIGCPTGYNLRVDIQHVSHVSRDVTHGKLLVWKRQLEGGNWPPTLASQNETGNCNELLPMPVSADWPHSALQ